MDVFRALRQRHSVRAFLNDSVPQETLRAIFGEAQHAPSWCNIQPWRVWVTSDAATGKLTDAITKAAKLDKTGNPDFSFPVAYPEPYRTYRIDCAKALYNAMGVARDDKPARDAAWLRNFAAFDAPHVAIVGMNTAFSIYGALDIGCWLQSVMLVATSLGVSTCAQASLATYPQAVRSVLSIPDNVGILVGIAMGYTDINAAANACKTDRAPLDSNVTFVS